MAMIGPRQVSGFVGIPRVVLGERPSPLQHHPALAEALGVPVDLWVKRDDLFGPGMGGNKVRKLEYVIAGALREGCDTLVTAGAVQSNHARLTAVAGALCGLDVHLVLSGDPATAGGGNLLLDELVGARTHFVKADTFDGLRAEMDALSDWLRASGATPKVVPVGASVPLGAVGYADTYVELIGQLDECGVAADWLLHASGSGGTQGGLLAGRTLTGRGPRVLGGRVEPMGDGELQRRVGELHRECTDAIRAAAAERHADALSPPTDGRPSVALPGLDATGAATAEAGDVRFGGEESPYGTVTAGGVRTMRTALRAAGLLLDPVYTAKALAALPGLVLDGVIAPGETVVFLHTGGSPAVFSSSVADALLACLRRDETG